jgi:carboxyl-terminal processing protease
MRKWWFFFLWVLLFSQSSWALTDKIYKEISTFTKILQIVDQNYVDPVDEKKLILGALNGMLSSLDPHTIYLPAEQYRDFSSDTKGRFGGIGIEVSVKDGIITVISPIQDSPADKAGVRSGDKILSIDGKTTKNMTLNDAVHLMRGPVGKRISLLIWHKGTTQASQVSMAREIIKVQSVKTEDWQEGYAYFTITMFQEGSAKNFKKEFEDFLDKNKNPVKGVILDLRDNPGGLLMEAVKLCDYLLTDGVIVSTKGRDKTVDVKKAHEAGTLPDFPMIVMINGGSASASEIVAGALQDQGRAKLVGTRSFGKGSVQTVINLDDGDALKITVAHYYTPKDRMIDGKGIDPDLLLDLKAYKKKFKIGKDDKTKVSREDFDKFQRDEALAYLKKMTH